VAFKKTCVLGLGYIGLPTACTLANHGLKVIGVDVNLQIVDTLRKGGLHIQEPGLQDMFLKAIKSKKLLVQEKPETADVFIIAVPTPFLEDKKADLSYVISASEMIAPFLRLGNLVILESTSPPRTTLDIVSPILEKSGLRAGEDFHLVYSPERVLPGRILEELIHNARVIGGINQKSADAGYRLYSIFVKGEIVLTDATTAEMVKLMENTFRDVNIAIANEFSRLADRFEVDIWRAISIANKHPRVNVLSPGPGVGGHCIGVDPWFLVEAAPDITPLIRTARQVNDEQPDFVLEIVKRGFGIDSLKDLSGKRISVLGLAYKPGIDDLRQSPAVGISRRLSDYGAIVCAFDPYVMDKKIPGIEIAQSWQNAVQNSELIALLVAHDQFKKLPPEELTTITQARVVVDAVNAWSSAAWRTAGFKVLSLGNERNWS
jgi:UDP-N-acetyl-D-mannosaminuronic acid dehydrogenase